MLAFFLLVLHHATSQQVCAYGNPGCWVTTTDTIQCVGDVSYLSASWSSLIDQVACGETDVCLCTQQGNVTCRNTTPPPNTLLTTITMGRNFTCGIILSTRQPTCWGNAPVVGLVAGSPWPTLIFEQLAAGDQHVCGMTTHVVVCWGPSNMLGQLTPPNGNGTIIKMLACGGNTCCLVTSLNLVSCWGDDTYGQGKGSPHTHTHLGLSSQWSATIRNRDRGSGGKTCVCHNNGWSGYAQSANRPCALLTRVVVI